MLWFTILILPVYLFIGFRTANSKYRSVIVKYQAAAEDWLENRTKRTGKTRHNHVMSCKYSRKHCEHYEFFVCYFCEREAEAARRNESCDCWAAPDKPVYKWRHVFIGPAYFAIALAVGAVTLAGTGLSRSRNALYNCVGIGYYTDPIEMDRIEREAGLK